jgi:hypothetical protein
MRVGGLGGTPGRASCSDEGAEGTGGEGRHEALAEGTAHLRTHPHNTIPPPK